MRGILTYHSIDGSGSAISVDPRTFRGHMEWLATSGVRVLDLAELAGGGTEGVAITFDDGFENFVSEAWPVLRYYGMPVTLFVATDHVGAANAWGGKAGPSVPQLPLLSWDALGRLAGEGVTIGAHSRTHRDLRTLRGEVLEDEVHGSGRCIEERTGRFPAAFAYPFGTHDAQTVDAVAKSYAWACTTELRPLAARDDPHRLPRVDAWYLRGQGRLETWGTPGFARYLRFRNGLRRTKQWLTPTSKG